MTIVDVGNMLYESHFVFMKCRGRHSRFFQGCECQMLERLLLSAHKNDRYRSNGEGAVLVGVLQQ